MSTCQKIQCSVGSCMYNTPENNMCTLSSIQISPAAKAKSGAPYDETLCSSYMTYEQKK